MEIALATPVVSLIPGAHAPWEVTAGPAELVEIARTADRLGFDYLTCSEHVAITPAEQPAAGVRFYDPLATFGFLAAHTTRIRFLTYAVGLGYHHPLEIAKRYGTLDVVCGGRLVLGLGLGADRVEFDLLGMPFEGRGRRADDALRVLRAALGSTGPISHVTDHFTFGDVVVEPSGTRRPPLWIAGGSLGSLDRAISLGDGWMPSVFLPPERIGRMLAAFDRPAGFTVVLPVLPPVDPVGDPAGTAAALAARAALGADVAVVGVRHTSLVHYLEQLDALRQVIGASVGSPS
jgi:probable F420-dependent oxidoreductase